MIEAARVERMFSMLALIVLGLALTASVTRPLFYWDSWAYHLPFSALLWNIDDAARTFVLSEEMRVRYEGFPLFAEFVQGALWKLTGTINSTPLVNSAGLAALVLTAAKSLRLSVPVLAFGTLSVPLVALHATSNYIDLFVAVCVCFQFLAAVKLSGLSDARGARIALWAVVYVAAAAAAGNSKVTGLVMSMAISGFVLAHTCLRARSASRKPFSIVIAAIIVGGTLAAGTALKNSYLHSNPLYPFDVTVAGVHLQGPEPEYRNYPDYTAPLGVLARPANWLLSITEIDWHVRGVAQRYSLDLSHGDKPARHGPARTGGYWGALMTLTLLLAVGLAVFTARRRPGALRAHAPFLALFGLVTVVTAFMPQSHELRYHLHWPLLLMLTVAMLVRAAGLSAAVRAALATAYLGAFLVTQVMLDVPFKPWPNMPQAGIVRQQSSPAEIAQARKSGSACLGPEYNPRQFAYSAVFQGGDYVIEQGWTRCVGPKPRGP